MTGKLPTRLSLVAALIATVLLATSATAQVEDHQDIVYPELREFTIPTPEIFDLPNGMKIFLLEDHELPLIRASARIRTGSVYEPDDKVGLAQLAGAVQRTGGTRGSRTMSGDELDDFLEARAASIETSIGNTVGFASMDCLREDFDDVFAVFRDVLRYPAFSEDKLEIAKAQTKAGIARRNDNVGGIVGREFSRLIYGLDSPLSRLTEYATVAAVERGDLEAWHAKYYHPNNIYLGVTGDFDSKSMKKKIRAVFADWPLGEASELAPVAYEQEMKPGTYFIEKTDVTQANIQLGHLGMVVADDPDYFAVRVMNQVLGGSFASRLFTTIRSDMGLAYNVGGSISASYIYPGVASFGLSTKSETMAQSVDALYDVLRGMHTDPVTEDEIDRAKDAILNSFIFNYASTGQVLSQQMLYSYYGLPLDFLDSFRSKVESVTREDVMRVAKKYLHPDKMTLLVVGKPEDFDRPMDTFGEFQVVDITIPSPEVELAAVEQTEEGAAAGRALLDAVVAALGGSGEPASAIKSSEDVVVSMQGQTMAISRDVVIVYPDRVYAAIQTPMGQQVVVMDGDEGFMAMGGQSRPAQSGQIEQQRKNLAHEIFYVLRYHDAENVEAIAAGEEEVEGTSCSVLAVTFKGEASRWCVDDGGRVLKAAFESQHPFTQTPGLFEVVFSDYRDVDGRLVPHKRVTSVDGAPLFDATLKSFEVDPVIDPALFEKPAA